jgi:stage V sporulation protein D (sporulation-specific penicillin-binding protein)
MKFSLFHLFGKKDKRKEASPSVPVPHWQSGSSYSRRLSIDTDSLRVTAGRYKKNERILSLEPDRGALKKGRKRASAIGTLIAFCVVVVVGRLFQLQIIEGSSLERRALSQISGENIEIAPRGSIVDRNGETLAVSIISKSLYVNPQELVDNPDRWPIGKAPVRDPKQVAAAKLSSLLEMPEADLLEIFNMSDRQFVWVKRTLDPHVANEVENFLKEEKISGFHFQEESKRYYPKDKLAAQVLGFVGVDDNGLEGVEASMDKELKGSKETQTNYLDAKGNLIGKSGFNEVQLQRKNTVQLTLDAQMQFILERSLDDAIKKTKAASAAAILMDPNTGEILGMASRPTFDPNNFSKASSAAFMNRGVGIIYEPGSVFKPIMGCAGLMEGIVTPDTPFNDTGSIDVGGRRIRNWDGQGLGKIKFEDIIKFSVNTGMAALGLKLGGEKETEYARRFGFGEATGTDVPGEEIGILYNPEDMVPSDVATMGIGQGIAVTPLQMLRAICAIANGGNLVKPYVVKRVISPEGNVIKENSTVVERQVITPEVAEQMRTMMEKVVSEGGGRSAQIKGYKIAGKTGTAEKLSPNGGYIPGVYIASFVGFVPSDAPKYAMIIMIDSPQGAYYGAQVSAPIFRDTLQQILVAKGIQPNNSKGLPSVESLTVKDSGKETVLPDLKPDEEGKVRLPNLAGYSMRQVAKILEGGGLSLVPVGSGTSWQQNPLPGTILGRGDLVTVWFR